mgnify:CR=1 FL=1
MRERPAGIEHLLMPFQVRELPLIEDKSRRVGLQLADQATDPVLVARVEEGLNIAVPRGNAAEIVCVGKRERQEIAPPSVPTCVRQLWWTPMSRQNLVPFEMVF